jgi:hypothetical protein
MRKTKLKTIALIGILLVLPLLFAGCASETNDTQTTQETSVQQQDMPPFDDLGAPTDDGQGPPGLPPGVDEVPN